GQRRTLATSCLSPIPCTASDAGRISAIVTARGRIGYAFDSVMAYVTGGGAMVSVADNLTLAIGGASAAFPTLWATALGWTAGAGIEVNFWGHWSAKLEYLYVGVANATSQATIPFTLGAGTAYDGATYRESIVRFGVNYRFGPEGRVAPVAPYPV